MEQFSWLRLSCSEAVWESSRGGLVACAVFHECVLIRSTTL